jgi:hypothetical protein
MTIKASRAASIAGPAAVLAAWFILACPADGQSVVLDDGGAGLEAWRRIESVLVQPRCLNCHAVSDYPRRGDDRQPHGLAARRGPDEHGAAPNCDACHLDRNQAGPGIPGAKGWHMPPIALAWESEAGKPAHGGALCASLKPPTAEGEPDYERLIEYVQFAPTVLWAWRPGQPPDGTTRALPPISHDAFVDAIKHWVSAGAPCPSGTD